MSRNPTNRQRPNQSSSHTPVHPRRRPDGSRRREALIAVVVILVVVAALGGLYALYRGSAPGASQESASAPPGSTESATQGSDKYPFAVGSPGPGQKAPGLTLPSSTGGTVSLSDYRGKNVLLYFQAGLMCQACWTQITDYERKIDKLKAAGIDEVVSITGDPADLVARKVRDEGITTPVLSDSNKAVSKTYNTLKYGMMNGKRNGHSFILVGPDGTIRWRADYGGPPKYTMFLPTEAMLADLRTGLARR